MGEVDQTFGQGGMFKLQGEAERFKERITELEQMKLKAWLLVVACCGLWGLLSGQTTSL